MVTNILQRPAALIFRAEFLQTEAVGFSKTSVTSCGTACSHNSECHNQILIAMKTSTIIYAYYLFYNFSSHILSYRSYIF
jgi:hypothetical protein